MPVSNCVCCYLSLTVCLVILIIVVWAEMDVDYQFEMLRSVLKNVVLIKKNVVF